MVVNDGTPELDEKLVISLTSATLVGSSDGQCSGLKQKYIRTLHAQVWSNTVSRTSTKDNRAGVNMLVMA